jgi:UDP-N-acetyl-D-glucosamine dehydrogenase
VHCESVERVSEAPTGVEQVATKRVAVFGLGYVGLPLIRACINAGHAVIGFDINPNVVANLKAGRSHINDVDDDEIQRWLATGFLPTTHQSDLTQIDVFIICVPTPLTKSGGPDLTAVEAATRTIEAQLNDKLKPLVVLESTTYPGTTEEVVKPILEKNGRTAGRDFALAFSPERIDPGNKTFTFENTPKVVGGFTHQCAVAATEFYQEIVVQVVPVKGLKEAEMTKLLENTYRHVNIALVNELAKLSHLMGIDIWDVIQAAETKPYGFQAFRPGPGVGGHCIPIDPNYLSHRVRTELGQSFRFVELAQEINASMPHYVVQRVQEILNEDGIALSGAAILILGVTYKRDIADIRESPAVPVIKELVRLGANVSYHDPYVDDLIIGATQIPRSTDLPIDVPNAACIILIQDHSEYRENAALLEARRILDTRGVSIDRNEGKNTTTRWARL